MYINQDSGLVYDTYLGEGERLDAFVAPLVWALNEKGFMVVESCDGHRIGDPILLLFHKEIGRDELDALALQLSTNLHEQQLIGLHGPVANTFIALKEIDTVKQPNGRYTLEIHPKDEPLYDDYGLDRGEGEDQVPTDVWMQWNKAVCISQLLVALRSVPKRVKQVGKLISTEQLRQVSAGTLILKHTSVVVSTKNEGLKNCREFERAVINGIEWALVPAEQLAD